MIKLGWLRTRLETSQQLAIACGSLLFLLFIYFWSLGSLTAGMSSAEVQTRGLSSSGSLLYHHATNAPHNVLLYALIKLHHLGPLATRSVSATFAIVFIFCFYRAARSWFGRLTGWLATLLFATTPLVLLAGRSATPTIMFLGLLPVAAAYFWLVRSPHQSKAAYLSLFALAALSLYAPGVIYFLVLAFVAIAPSIKPLVKSFPRWLTWLGACLFLVILVPLVVSMILTPSSIRLYFLLPSHFPRVWTVLRNISWMFSGLVWRTGGHGELQLGRLGLANAAQLGLAVFGLAALWGRARAKCYALLAAIALSAILAGISNDYSVLLFAVAPICILAAGGLRYLFIEWHSIFPRNPIPRILAITLMCAVVAISVFYGLRYSLSAWPHSVATSDAYVLK